MRMMYEAVNFRLCRMNYQFARDRLRPTASCGPDEHIIKIAGKTLVLAKPDIPDRP